MGTLERLCTRLGSLKDRIGLTLLSKSGRLSADDATVDFYANMAREFSRSVGGDQAAFDRGLSKGLRSPAFFGDIYQDILTAFMPHFEENLYAFYLQQQYAMLYRFLQYPSLIGLKTYTEPYAQGLAALGQRPLAVLDYGAGVPYGLIEALRSGAAHPEAVFLVDLDLVHSHYAEFILRRVSPDLNLEYFLLKDTEESFTPTSKCNFIMGKDIFEHLHEPEKKLEHLMRFCADEAVCFFDFRDHGEKIHQHVSPQIGHLDARMLDFGFTRRGQVMATTLYTRNL